ncbi:hypothetical protein OG912_32470 [Streptomyces sp. NBC_00464]|uniref:hypothetical protein n=1 Tax=Streptomyces sp. NBC_00464 TaxID=2975751 RepID=UPI002E16CECB
MKQRIADLDGEFLTVSVNEGSRPGIIYVDDGSTEYGPLEFTATSARELAHALLRAADEAEGVNHFDALEALIVKITRERTASFIRANIDMQGRDFPDAESVAVWLEES